MTTEPYQRRARTAVRRFCSGSVSLGVLVVGFTKMTALFTVGQLASSVDGTRPVVVVEFLAALIALVLLNSVFVAGETAIELLKPSHIKALGEGSEKREAALRDMIARKSSFVAACSLGSTTMRAWMVAFAVFPAIPVSNWLKSQWPAFDDWAKLGDLGFAGTVLVAVLLLAIPIVAINVIFGELIPKSYASSHPQMTSLRLYGPVKLCNTLFSLPIAVFLSLASIVTRRFGARATFAMTNQAEEEIKELLEEAEESGEINVDEREMVASVFEFGDTVAREVMTPRVDIEALPIGSALSEVVKVIENTGHSRIPVYEGTDDTILGIVHAKDVLRVLLSTGAGTPLRELIRPALFVPEGKPLHDLLREMQQHKSQMAIVQDEQGGTAGIVTIEDIVEEVMGEIVDEYDSDLPQIVPVDGGFVSDGKIELEDVNDVIGSSFESEEFDTIGGYVFDLFGRQPKQGEAIEGDGYRFIVRDTDGKRVTSLLIEQLPQDDGSNVESIGQ